ncbi:hypothetical protein WEI85_00565 [Actinomycetes bacterium KLBMP 9797]
MMAKTTAQQFARQLRRLGATVEVRNGCDVVARYRGVEVTAHFHPDVNEFDSAWRSDSAQNDTPVIRSMAGVRRTLGLPKQPVVTIGRTGRRNSLAHIVPAGWASIAECGVGIHGQPAEGSIRDVTCRRCKSIWRQR